MSSRPDTAQEVILACCIEEPQNEYDRNHSLRLDESGFAFWHNHLPAMYFTGPWLLFLRTSPAHALKTILRLIEFATDRWAEGYKAFTRTAELPAFKILLDGTEKDFVGDGNVSIGIATCPTTRLLSKARSWPLKSGSMNASTIKWRLLTISSNFG